MLRGLGCLAHGSVISAFAFPIFSIATTFRFRWPVSTSTYKTVRWVIGDSGLLSGKGVYQELIPP